MLSAKVSILKRLCWYLLTEIFLPPRYPQMCGAIEGRLSHFLPHWLRTGRVVPLREDWAIFCHTGSGRVSRVWPEILRHGRELNPGHKKTDSEIHSFSHWAIATVCAIIFHQNLIRPLQLLSVARWANCAITQKFSSFSSALLHLWLESYQRPAGLSTINAAIALKWAIVIGSR